MVSKWEFDPNKSFPALTKGGVVMYVLYVYIYYIIIYVCINLNPFKNQHTQILPKLVQSFLSVASFCQSVHMFLDRKIRGYHHSDTRYP